MVESSTINLRRVLSELGNDTGSVENVSWVPNSVDC